MSSDLIQAGLYAVVLVALAVPLGLYMAGVFSGGVRFLAPVEAAVLGAAGVDLDVARGEVCVLMGLSGSGKSTVLRVLSGLNLGDWDGTLAFSGRAAGKKRDRAFFRRVQMVFQDPLGALDRRMTAAAQIAEPLVIHGPAESAARAARVAELIDAVGLSSTQAQRYPHELSGGQRQRVVIARALATRPDLIVCDEPVSALDVSIQAQIINLLEELKERFGLTLVIVA
ncbi:ATP-binding cassette domain-containing protein, partial [Mycobacterium tuberculosis]|nr:ATP-binding cassette domain-containing protein [Mycobacterium tuberculosis]